MARLDPFHTDFSRLGVADVPEIVNAIRLLQKIARDSKISTTKIQSKILRECKEDVLSALAEKLLEAKLCGEGGGK